MRTDKYTDKQGVERYSTDIIANEMQMLGGNEGKPDRQQSSGRDATSGQRSSVPDGDGFDSEIPF